MKYDIVYVKYNKIRDQKKQKYTENLMEFQVIQEK